ncbi:hypothetical protein KSP40_PGU008752 [Platanthera guangdongensis]|uniref:Uncharacterized protein n=1 Tax=Platanthera guangdongensis TaxID=2320717 RepID=A0ABR2MLP5_9ASPA
MSSPINCCSVLGATPTHRSAPCRPLSQLFSAATVLSRFSNRGFLALKQPPIWRFLSGQCKIYRNWILELVSRRTDLVEPVIRFLASLLEGSRPEIVLATVCLLSGKEEQTYKFFSGLDTRILSSQLGDSLIKVLEWQYHLWWSANKNDIKGLCGLTNQTVTTTVREVRPVPAQGACRARPQERSVTRQRLFAKRYPAGRDGL